MSFGDAENDLESTLVAPAQQLDDIEDIMVNHNKDKEVLPVATLQEDIESDSKNEQSAPPCTRTRLEWTACIPKRPYDEYINTTMSKDFKGKDIIYNVMKHFLITK